jgi:hypothetical protein
MCGVELLGMEPIAQVQFSFDDKNLKQHTCKGCVKGEMKL